MAIRDAIELAFSPQGLTDAFDELDSFPGACRSLSNLILDASNRMQVLARPGVGTPTTTFAGFTTPTFVSIQVTVGAITYGMVSSARFPGHDEPFAWDNVNQVFITISGVLSTNVPASLPSAGAWTPPTAAMVASQLIFTHTGFSGTGSNFVGAIDIVTNAWTTNNTATNLLPSVPTAVANYENRAWYVCGNLVYFSDSLSPFTMSLGTQSVTVGDSTHVTGMSGLPMQTLSSGITAALIIFKANQTWMVTGDTATNNLALVFLSLTIGCSSPRSIAQTPIGTIFIGQDAPYILTQSATVEELHAPQNSVADIRVPFQNAQVPSRIAASFAGNIYRVCLETIIDSAIVTNDYWFDLRRMRWSGPHSFTYDCASQYGENFILSGVGTGAALFSSIASNPTLGSTYLDNGIQIMCSLTSTSLATENVMEYKQIVQSSIDLSSGGSGYVAGFQLLNAFNQVLATAFIGSLSSNITWGNFTWGAALWNSVLLRAYRYDLWWNQPAVSDRIIFTVLTPAGAALMIGKFLSYYQRCGYTLRPVSSNMAQSVLNAQFILDQSTLG